MHTMTKTHTVNTSTPGAQWPPEVRAAWLEARALNAARLGRETAQQALLDQASGTVPYTRPAQYRIIDR